MNCKTMSKPISFYQNQLHRKPRLKYDCQQKVRLFFKSGENTMLLCKGMTALAADSLAMYIESYIKKHNSKIEGRFLQTRA